MTATRFAQGLRPWSAVGFNGEMKQVFDRLFGEDASDQSDVVTSQWTPRVDIKEETERFVIYADIPGVEPKDIEIHMDKGILTLKGERSAGGAVAKAIAFRAWNAPMARSIAASPCRTAPTLKASLRPAGMACWRSAFRRSQRPRRAAFKSVERSGQ